ncbi:unnamed protein product [Closterium sp. NIES-53]
MATSPDSSSTVVRRHRPVYTPSPAAARARPTPRPDMPQSSPAASGSTEDEPSSNADRPRPPLPRVAVPTFPQRNRPQGQVKRNADAEPPSPRHRMTKRVRHSYTAKEKLHWLKMQEFQPVQEFQPDLSNRALAKLAKVLVPFMKPLRETTGRRREALVVLDSYRGHLTEAVGQTMRMFRLSRAIIPGGCTPLVQPLDVSINRAFKCGDLQKPPAETVLRWIDESWEAVPEELVKKAFVTCGISTSIDGTEDHLILAHMRDKGEVEVLDDVNEILGRGVRRKRLADTIPFFKCNLQKPPAETVLRWIDESWEAVPEELVKKAFVTCGISTSIDGTEDHLILAHMRDKGEVEVLDDVNEMVDDETVVNPFYAKVPMPAEEVQVEEEDDAAEAEAEAEDEDGVGPADGEEAGECSDDDDWWRPGRFDGEEDEEWHAGDDDE